MAVFRFLSWPYFISLIGWAHFNQQKAGLIVEGVTYNTTNEVFDKEIFTAECHRVALSKVFPALRAVTDYVVTDGTAEQSVERKFVENLDKADEVAVYAKLPRGFYIPTPVGKYSPDWAIAFKDPLCPVIEFWIRCGNHF